MKLNNYLWCCWIAVSDLFDTDYFSFLDELIFGIIDIRLFITIFLFLIGIHVFGSKSILIWYVY